MLDVSGYNQRTDGVLATHPSALTPATDGAVAVADQTLFDIPQDAKRRCCTCKQHKLLSEFNRHAGDSLGRQKRCRACQRIASDIYNSKPSVLAHRAAQRRVNAAEKSAYDRARYLEKIDDIRVYQKTHYAKNRDRIIAQVKEWAANNKDTIGVIKKNYKAKRRAQELSGTRTRDLAKWAKAQPKVCHWCACGCEDDHHLDHFIPLSKGGRHEIDNLVIACRLCNLRKNARMPDEFMDLLLGGFYA